MSLTIRDVTSLLRTPASRTYSRRSLNRVTTIILHHTGVLSSKRPRGGWLTTVKAIAKYHVVNKNWPGIGYHYLIAPDGVVYKCNAVSALSWHATGGNTHGIGVSLMGNFERQKPTALQLEAADALVHEIKRNMPQVVNVVPHRLVKGSATACPGKNLSNETIARLGG